MASRAGADAGTGQWRVVEGRRGTGRAVGGEDGGGGVGGELAVGEDEAALATEERRESRWIGRGSSFRGRICRPSARPPPEPRSSSTGASSATITSPSSGRRRPICSTRIAGPILATDDSAQKAGKTIAVIIGLMAGVALIIVFASFIRRRTRNSKL
ncbi:uncharacterized protein LOC109821756 [Asparagus officinalis]|uniref:uncharacterized protein LOC109821756 n=1 Tax=Asparagus officinalis TaxID=4686 RepID=UPI00098E8007|nr:uncharacterized protein LOC109821756 [Asparagus officinalis]